MVLFVLALLLAVAGSAQAAQPQFWKIEGARDFLDGTTEGLSVDSEGRVRLAPATSVLQDPEAPAVWCLARDAGGTLYAGTGNDGKVFRITGGKGSVFFQASELEVHALAIGPDGHLYVGTSPNGKVYAVDSAGKSRVFYDPQSKYIWALAFDPAGNLLVATGGDAKIHRVDRQGKGQVVFTSFETHLTALALDGKGNLYVGSSPGGILYRVDPSLKVFVLHDSPYREVKALELGPDGSLYAAVVDGKEKEETTRPHPLPTPPTSPAAEVTISESFSLGPSSTQPQPASLPRIPEPRAGSQKGALLRVLATGEVDVLWSSPDETPHSIVRSEAGVLVGTGNKGKLYEIRDDRTWTMLAEFPAEQVTGLWRGPAGTLLATSNPGKIYALAAAVQPKGTFTSKVKDTDTVSAWGRLRWGASLPQGTEVQIHTRSGNTSNPDSTWSDWSKPYTHATGDPITSERARFLQVRAVLSGSGGACPVLDSLVAAYLQRNLRPQVLSVTVHPPGEVFQKPIALTGEIEILGLESPSPDRGNPQPPRLPPVTSYSRKQYQKGIQTFSWRAEDPNGDTLVYEVHYRLANDSRLHLLRKGLTEPVLAWDTSTVPNGRYVVRITASDAPSNPESLALSADKESAPFDVDNTPPSVSLTLLEANHVRAVVRDDNSIIRKAEYSVDGGRWQEVYPVDGINDALQETYEFTLGGLPSGPHSVVVRATDLLGNAATGQIQIK